MKPFHLYLLGTGSWFFAFGIQSVMFAWLVTMVLHESPQMVGIAQMTMLVPTMLLILVGGSLADIVGGRRIVIVAQSMAALPPLFLFFVVLSDNLTFTSMIYYAIVMGLAQAFVTPSRDGLLNQVAEAGIQRAVVRASMMQFGVQLLGLAIASLAEHTGPLPILLVQTHCACNRCAVLFAHPRPPFPGEAAASSVARFRTIHRRGLPDDRRLTVHADDRSAELCDGHVLHGVVHRDVAVAGAGILRRFRRGSCADERRKRTGTRYDHLHPDASGRHPQARSCAVAGPRDRRRDARLHRHRRQLYRCCAF